jgi:hypothetical protein
MEEKLPASCQLDRNRLTVMETKIDQILDNQTSFISIDGPLGKVRDEVKKVGSLANAAHKRLDEHEHDIASIANRQWQIVVKVAGGVLGGGGVLVIIMKAVEGFLK